MNILPRVPVLTGMALLLAACSSAPTHFYTLLRPQADAELAGGRPALTIDLQPVEVPVQLDQRPMVVRLGNSEVALVESRRWIAPLGDEIHAALGDELNRRLGRAGTTQGLADGASSALPGYRVLVDVQRFDGWLAHRIDFAADWTVIETAPGSSDAHRRWACNSVLTQNVAAGYPALVSGAQQAISALAGDIAGLIIAAQSTPPSSNARLSCPTHASAPQ